MWRAEFGEEFDALVEHSGVSARDAIDICLRALHLRVTSSTPFMALLVAWGVLSFMNIAATEVQWPAGALLLFSFIAALWQPSRWVRNSILLFLAIPVSSLYFYQIPHIHHEPLYKTAVALVPAFIGALSGLAVQAVHGGPSKGRLS